MNKYIVIAVIITVLFSVIKYALTYKEHPKPNLKDSAVVFGCALASLYVYDMYIDKTVTTKVSEIFTGPPEF